MHPTRALSQLVETLSTAAAVCAGEILRRRNYYLLSLDFDRLTADIKTASAGAVNDVYRWQQAESLTDTQLQDMIAARGHSIAVEATDRYIAEDSKRREEQARERAEALPLRPNRRGESKLYK